jgi:hypothetical protein
MLFKILHGDESNISLDVTPFHEGWCYVTHSGYFYVDLNIGTAESPNNQRIKLNAANCETLMGKSLVELQSDWSVNDETSPAYIKNRPFYTTDPQEIKLYDGTVAFREITQGNITIYMSDSDQLTEYDEFFVGQHVKVIFDGVEYDLEAKSYQGDIYVGNGSIVNFLYGGNEENTGEPFYYSLGRVFVTNSTGAEHTIVASAYHTEDISIPHEYLGINVWNGEGENSVVLNANDNTASGYGSTAMGLTTTASGNYAHAEGNETVASGDNSHAEGNDTTASSYNAHAEGNETIASGHTSHAEGLRTEASGQGSHAEGHNTKASAYSAHAEGYGTEAASKSQHVFGEYNIVDKSAGAATRGKYIQIAGNGNSANAKSNAYTLDWSGNAWFKGNIKVGGTGQDDAAAKTLATTEQVSAIA